MDFIFNDEAKKIIKETLGLKKEKLNESLVAQEKQFTINTDLLSEKNINNHKELYAGYIKIILNFALLSLMKHSI